MGKAVKEGLKAALAVALIAATGGALLFGAQYGLAAGALGGLSFVGMTNIIAIGVVTAIGVAISKPIDATLENFGRKVSAKDPLAPRQIIYGKTKVGGTIVHMESTGTDNAFLNVIIAIAGHEIQSIEKIFLNNVEVTASSATEDGTTVYTVTNTDFTNTDNANAYGSGRLIKYVFGLGSDTQDMNGFTIAKTSFTADHDLKGIAYVHFRMTFDQEKLGGIPEISFEVKGRKLYDPRKDSTNGGSGSHRSDDASTWEWSHNPVLAVRDYLYDTRYGLRATDDEINDTNIIAQANACEVQVNDKDGNAHDKYSANGLINATTDGAEALQGILSSCAGKVVFSNGAFNVIVGGTKTPDFTIVDDDLISDISVSNSSDLGNLYNTVKPVFIDSGEDYVSTDSPLRNSGQDSSGSNENYLTSDTPSGESSNNYKKILEMKLPFVTNDSQAQRLGKIALNYQRRSKIIEVSTTLRALQLQVGDWVYVTNDRLSYSNKTFEVLSINTEVATGDNPFVFCKLGLKEVDNQIFAFNTSSDYLSVTTGTIGDDGDATVSPPTLASNGLSQGNTNDNGTIKSHIDVTWTNATSSNVVQTEIQWRQGGTFGTPTSSAIVDKAQTTFRIENVIEGQAYYVRVRHIGVNDIKSNFSTVRNITVTGDTTAPSTPTNLAATTGVPQQIKVSWTNPSDSDLRAVKVHRKTANSNPTDDSTVIATVAGEPSLSTYIFTGVDDGLSYGTTYYFWVSAVDHSGNESALSSSVSGSFIRTRDDDFQGRGGGIFLFSQAGNKNAPSDADFNTQEGRKPRNNDIVVSKNTTTNESVAYKYSGQTAGSEGGGGSFSSTGLLLTGDLIGLEGEGIQDILNNTTTGNQGDITFNKHTTKIQTYNQYVATTDNLPQLILYNQRKTGQTNDTGLNAGSLLFTTNLRDSSTNANLATEQNVAGMFIDMNNRTAGFGLNSSNPSAKIKFKVVQAPVTSGGSYNLVDLLTLDRHNGSQLDSSLNIDDADSNGYLHIGDTTVIDASKAFKNILIADDTPSSTTNKLYQASSTLYWNGSEVAVGAINSVTNMADNRVLTASGANSANGEANLTFDGSTLGVTGSVTVSGDLTVSGTTTTIDTTNLDVADKNITLNYSTGDSSANANGAGITIQDAVNSTTDATILWDATNDEFDFSHGITLPDSKKLKLGTGGDLQIYHDGSHARLREITGEFRIQTTTSGVNALVAKQNAEVELYHAGSKKLATKSDGVDITGELQSDSLDVDGNADISGDVTITNKLIHSGDTDTYMKFDTNQIGFIAGNSTRFQIQTSLVRFNQEGLNQDFQIFGENEDNLFYVDASTDRVGIGTTAPARKFTVQGGSGDNLPVRIIGGATTTKSAIEFQDPSTTADYKVTLGSVGDNLFFQAGGSERARIDSSGNLCIGNTSAGAKLDIRQDSGYAIRCENGSGHYFRVNSTGAVEVAGSEVITASRNLTNIGTISSGAITSSGSVTIQDSNTDFNIEGDSSNNTYFKSNGQIRVRPEGTTTNKIVMDSSFLNAPAYQVGGTEVIDSSRNIKAVDVNLTGSIQNTTVPAEASVKINENGYNDGTTYFRDLDIFDGKGNQFVKFDGSTQRVGIGTTSAGRQLELKGEGVMRLNADSGDCGIDFQTAGTNDMQFRYRAASDTLAVYSYGTSSDVFNIKKATGYIGIGTASPNYLLDVEGTGSTLARLNSTSGSALFQISVPDTTSICDINFGDTGHTQRGQIRYRHNGDSLAFSTAQTEAVRIDSSQRVGIGTSSPAGELHVVGATGGQGQIYVSDADNGTGGSDSLLITKSGTVAYVYNRDNGSMRFGANDNASHMVIQTDGDVGINTASPAGKLHIKDTSNPASPNGSVVIEGQRDGTANLMELRARDHSSSSSALPANQGGIIRMNGFDGTDFEEMAFIGYQAEATVADGDAPSRLIFGTTSDGSGATTEKMRLTSAGRLGLGTTSPSTALQVGDGTAQSVVRVKYSDNTHTNIHGWGMELDRSTSYIRPSGNNSKTLHFGYSNKAWNYLHIYYNNYTRWLKGSTEYMRLDSSGRLGIGTTSAGEKLQVNGNFKLEESAPIMICRSTNNSSGLRISVDNNVGSTANIVRFQYQYATKHTFFANGNATFTGTLTENSDAKFKDNITPLGSQLAIVNQLNPVEYDRNDIEDTHEIGFIAQEVEKLIPDVVMTDKEGTKSLSYGRLVATLTKAIQEQQAQIESLQEQINNI